MLPRIETSTSTSGAIHCKRWFDSDGMMHRDDGPAVIWASGVEEWYQHGNRHREDGPAFIDPQRTSAIAWYVRGLYILNYEAFQKITNCNDQHITFLKLKWGEI